MKFSSGTEQRKPFARKKTPCVKIMTSMTDKGEKHMKHPAFHPEKMYTYLRDFASGAGMKETLKALAC